jgi:enoyl-CoA hydratase/carnithine racemase
MSEPILIREQHGLVRVLQLNRPAARNSLNPELMSQLGLELVAAEEAADTRCVVLTGTGERAFCAGMDLRGFRQTGSTLDDAATGTAGYLRFKQGDLAIPVVGAANATAVAGGLELLLACDLIVASESAQFGLPEVKRGLIAGGGGIFVGQRIPLAVALELTLTGDYIAADRALDLGLVNRVVPREIVLETAIDLAERISRNAPLAIQATKLLVRAANTDPSGAPEMLKMWKARVFESEDAREGAAAYIEKRTPVWRGR